MYTKKLQYFFKSKGLYQNEIAKILGYNPTMIGRYLSGAVNFKPEFISVLIKHFPEIDLKYIFSNDEDDSDELNDHKEKYNLKDVNVIKELEEIEKKVAKIKEFLAQKSHK